MSKSSATPGDQGATSAADKKAATGKTVETKLVDAAIGLMSTKAPSTISGRELAQRAGVNYGLIHHYFGSKYEVFQAAISKLVEQYINEISAVSEGSWLDLAVLEEHRHLWRVLAQYVLDEKTANRVEWPFKVMRHQLQVDGVDSAASRERAAIQAAFTFGWILFQPFIRDAYELDDGDVLRVVKRMNDLTSGL